MNARQIRALRAKYVASQWELVLATDAANARPGEKKLEERAIVAKRERDCLLAQMDAIP
jgi:hypothetical protein